MQYPWTIGQQFADETAYVTALTSAGFLAQVQVGVAGLLNSHTRFADGQVPIVIEAIGDYVSEMQQILAKARLAILVKTPSMRWVDTNVWEVSIVVQVLEFPAVNRTMAGPYITSMRGAEMALAILKDKSPCDGVSPFRPRSIDTVQASAGAANFALTGTVKTILSTVEV